MNDLPNTEVTILSIETTARRPARASGPADTPILSQAGAVGQGFDVFGALAMSSLIQPIFDSSKAGTKVFTFLGTDYLVPSFITPIEDTEGYFATSVCMTREDLQNYFAAHAGVEASVGAFSGEVQADYANQYQQSTQYAYAFYYWYSPLAWLELDGGTEYLSDEFTADVAKLPTEVDDTNFLQFFSFFEKWGAYYTTKILLGGQCSLCSAVSNSAALQSSQISTVFSAQYDGLFWSGSMSGSVTGSQAWQQYTSNVSCSVSAKGGTPTAISALSGISPLNPSTQTLAAFNAWVSSVSTDPAIVDFSLAGIWNLCGDKSDAVQSAWELYGNMMHPHLTIQTQGMSLPWPPPPAVAPVVMMGKAIVPDSPPATAAGYQLIVLDGNNLVDENGEVSGILLNKYYTLPYQQQWLFPDPNSPGAYYWQDPYNQMIADINANGLADENNLMILVGFSMDMNMPPPPASQSLFTATGGGSALGTWCQDTDAGSEEGIGWIYSGTNYVLVGFFGSGEGAGVEAFSQAPYGGVAATSLDVFFYRRVFGGNYTIAAG